MNPTLLTPSESRALGHVGLKGILNPPDLMKAKQRIRSELLRLGVNRWGLLKLETRYLPTIMHRDEHIFGAVYGRTEVGSVLLVATNMRVIYLDCKPFMTKSQDISYSVVAGVSLQWLGYSGTLVLNTRFGDYKLKTRNRRAAETFRNYIERRWIEFQNSADLVNLSAIENLLVDGRTTTVRNSSI